MLGKALPILLALIGLGGGIGAGIMLRPAPEVAVNPCADDPNALDQIHLPAASAHEGSSAYEYVKLNNQFVIPDMKDGKVAAMIVLSISLETLPAARETIYAREPKLRGEFLQVLFNHANIGGFQGTFTETTKMETLHNALLEVARSLLGDTVNDVIVTDIVRQDIG
ncbi:flagellar basal body-associated protein FliL [Celeribacter sp.]|uniref:flagellar basal body-associated protein FliL n=1 Tax=Celeribacter sp. TaxID=1890673 RepID=UPI003A94EE91